jgi:hypothetical protein
METGKGQQYFHVCLLSASLSSWRARFTRYLSARRARPTTLRHYSGFHMGAPWERCHLDIAGECSSSRSRDDQSSR